MNDRQLKVLQILSENPNKKITSMYLSIETDVSIRTIKSDFKYINEEYPFLVQSSNRGYSIDKKDLTRLSTNNIKNVVPQSPVERVRFILHYLLMDNEEYSISDFSELLFVSNSTVQKDLEMIKKWIQPYNLELKSKKAILKIKGLEKNKKKMLVELLYDELDENFFSLEKINKLFPEMNIEFIKESITRSLSKHGYLMNDFGLYSSIIHLCVHIKLIGKKNHESHYEPLLVHNQKQVMMVEEIFKEIEYYFSVNFNEADYNELSVLIISKIYPFDSDHRKKQEMEKEIEKDTLELTKIIIKEVNVYFLVNIDIDKVLIPFSIHLQNLKERIQNQASNHNPLTRSIKYSSPITYEIAVFVASIIKEEWQVTLSEGEIAFIAIHIGSALEFQKIFDNKIKACLIIPVYYSYSQNLIEKIDNLYHDQLSIVKIVSSLDDLEKSKGFDLYISVLPKPVNIIGIQWAEISMFLTPNDQMVIKEKIRDLKESAKKMKLSEKLKKISSPSLFFIDKKEKDYMHHSLKVISEKLLELNYVENNFLEKLILREELSTTAYPPFAIPHSIDMEASETVMSVYINPKGIDWNGKTVYLVIVLCFSSTKRESFNPVFRVLTDSLVKTQSINSLINVSSYDEFIKELDLLF